MAALTADAVTPYPLSYGSGALDYYPDRSGKIVSRQYLLVLTGQGGATNTIGAAVLGLSKILSASPLWDATNAKGYPAVIDPVNNVIILLDGSAAPAPVDVTTTAAYIRVVGTPKNSV